LKKITDFIINKRHFILILFIILSIVSAFMSKKVNINYDIAEYLPNTSETRIGMDIMEKEFKEIKDLNDLYNLFKSKNYRGDYKCWIKELNSSFKEFSDKINLSPLVFSSR